MPVTFIRVPDNSDESGAAGLRFRVIRVTSDLWRRHSADCDNRALGRDGLRCDCPLWADGYIDSIRVLRQSLDTRGLDEAQRRLDLLIQDRILEMFPAHATTESKPDSPLMNHPTARTPKELANSPEEIPVNDPRLIRNAGAAYLRNCETNRIKPSTIGKYRNVMNKLAEYSESEGVQKPRIDDFTITDLDGYRASRSNLSKITNLKELETLRQFWDFATVRGLCETNIARQVKAPIITEHNKVVPYKKKEMQAILNACDTFGQYEYERRRAKGMVVALRSTALRISDIALLRKDRISRYRGGYEIFLRTTKNNDAVLLPVPKEMMDALNALPTPRGASEDCPYFFWNGISKPKSMISVAEETLAAVFRESGVTDAGAHRFRHTLATELLGEGASFEEVADILGNSPAIVRKHYAKWSRKRQARVRNLMRKVHEGSRHKK